MNATKKIKLFFALAIPLFGLVSCEKDLDTEPETLIKEEYIFDTPGRILGQVTGLYDAVKTGSFLGGRYQIHSDIRGEEFINMKSNSVTGLLTWNHSLTSTAPEVENLWTAAYSAINKINLFLEGIEVNASKVDPVLLPQYKAEAKFLRALCYFDLVILYARPYTSNNGASPGLPLRLKGETTIANNDLARSSVKDVYDLILQDLDNAELNLPVTYTTPLLNVSRAHKSTAVALKCRVYLAMAKYNEVITEAAKIVSDNKAYPALLHKLEPNVATPFTNYTTSESIFSLPMTDGDGPGTQNQLGYYYNKSLPSAGEYSLNAKGILANTDWTDKDARRTSFILTGTPNYLKKYSSAAFTDYAPVIRYAETLLNYAEAAARTGDLKTATDLLKMIRNRSDAAYVFPATAIDTQDALIKTILTERRIELLGEGFRSFDLLRLNEAIPAKGSVNAIQPSQKEYIWPIPNSEMLTNKLMVQN
jgi:starch-binding outer membrane protein, SusD/RagB family